MKQWPALITGVLFGAGLALSGMTDPAKVLGFLDIAGQWVPDLAFVMASALAITLVATPLVLRLNKPVFAPDFSLPTRQSIDRRLIGGGVLFGIGWGVWGYCPGPAITALAYGKTDTVLFVGAMVAGMALDSALTRLTSHWQSASKASG